MRVAFNTCSLVSFHCSRFSLHLGVKPEDQVVYKIRGDREVEVPCMWVWGRATEQYDHCMEYFGLGPLALVCWLPGFLP